MDVEQPENQGYAKVIANDDAEDDAEDDADIDEEFSDDHDPLRPEPYGPSDTNDGSGDSNRADWWNKTLLPDKGIAIRDFPIVEGATTVKFLKFIILTFASIALVHVIIKRITNDRDKTMLLWHIWVFDSNLIVLDCAVFFVVGRLWRQRGVDHLAWLLPMIVCNVYFQSQHYFKWMQQSLTLYNMHCVWPWQLWIFVAILVPTIGAVVFLHVKRAWDTRLLLVKVFELALCVFFFLAPLAPSSYFHFHHWFAGWLLGMHCNFDVWWSRAAMAYCWGMYINGIAVYGRDPVLTCEYAYYLSMDMRCPYTKCYLDALKDMAEHPGNATHTVQKMEPIDWRNCSATGFHP
mmetsp:Transcript_114433/g.171116  ORF Transcript_114433/g.171116 Transcript_114433/m.171116 type:complete len:348 (+) Transcript_114433:82-1125(+)